LVLAKAGRQWPYIHTAYIVKGKGKGEHLL